ncbi:hypothetical protein PGUG_00030 [Meyerozyma guilliermondii ATCC 6260]|uniref:Zinc finger PHD-type domain-containing protein n=1 Tax=Meyerozyma guilliermondii (strain ATCC 6260 / CBS 566 / DSM 6381 / JCM 1539 / NBRC 10279 / NRRL Y-324) TaxID=294746 RepID=A5D9S5_PICGU|nr:uncharacterized protein PGUG_00030 [Meyerozyma guilliermondii ATCC 6260]EDK35932.2 hypothetical protein PGUG_00030 [Meyerozyma guilliermondii ATCC 6260]
MSVQHLSSINNAFISTVDHLPTDIIRSLWLIQSCNIEINKLEDELKGKDQISTFEFSDLKSKLERLYAEATSEAQALYNQLVTHKITLKDELEQLQSLSKNRNTSIVQPDKLKHQLEEHYKQHPLASFEKQPKAPIKLVLKVSKKNSTTKPQKKEKLVPYVPPPTIEEPIDTTLYCFCKQPSSGDMIGCDNETSCPNGDWFHYKCVGIMNRVQALPYTTGKKPWYCSEHCRQKVEKRRRRR